jgi:hypothetical protein
VLSRVDTSAGCTVKDCVFALSLGTHGFSLLLEAEWIVQRSSEAGSGRGAGAELAWRRVADAVQLAQWEDAWRDDATAGTFPASLLNSDLVFFAADAGDSLVAGAIAYPTDGVVGVSNVFAQSMSRSEIWPGCARAISERYPDSPIVGYAVCNRTS